MNAFGLNQYGLNFGETVEIQKPTSLSVADVVNLTPGSVDVIRSVSYTVDSGTGGQLRMRINALSPDPSNSVELRINGGAWLADAVAHNIVNGDTVEVKSDGPTLDNDTISRQVIFDNSSDVMASLQDIWQLSSTGTDVTFSGTIPGQSGLTNSPFVWDGSGYTFNDATSYTLNGAGSLPAGLSFNSLTGEITGTPTAEASILNFLSITGNGTALGATSNQFDLVIANGDPQFNILPSFGNDLSVTVESNVASVTGADGSYVVALSGDATLEVSIDGGVYTNSPANFIIPTNTTIQARITSSANYSNLVQGTVAIGVTSDNFNVFTKPDPSSSGGFGGGLSIGLGIGLTKVKPK